MVPQYFHRAAFIEQLEETADDSGAAFIEPALIVNPGVASERFDRRAALQRALLS